MKSLLKSIAISIGLVLSFASVSYAYTTKIPDYTPSTFETYLAGQEAVSDTSMSLAKGTLNDGQLLSGYQCFVVDSSSPSQEFECGTVSGASATGATVSNLIRGLDYLAGTSTESSQIFLHRRGADVKVSDFPILDYLTRMFTGSDYFPNVISYATTTSTSTISGANIPDAAWVLAQTQSVLSVSNSDGTLTISPTFGSIVASLNLAHANLWTASSTFTNGLSAITGTTTNFVSTTINNSATTTTGNLVVSNMEGVGTTSPWTNLTVASGAVLVSEYKPATTTTMTIDWRNGNSQLIQMGSAGMSIKHSNYLAGQHLLLTVCNPNGTAGAITWPNTEWGGSGTIPTQTTTANFCDVWSFIATQATSTTGALKVFGTAATAFE